MVGILVLTALIFEQRQSNMWQRTVAEMVREIVIARFTRAAPRLSEVLDQLLVYLGWHDARLLVADRVFAAWPPSNSAGNPAFAGF